MDQDDSLLNKNSQRGTKAQLSLDSCLMCLKTKDKLLHLLTHLQGRNVDPEENTIELIIEGLDALIEDLLLKDQEVELGRTKLSADVQKLI